MQKRISTVKVHHHVSVSVYLCNLSVSEFFNTLTTSIKGTQISLLIHHTESYIFPSFPPTVLQITKTTSLILPHWNTFSLKVWISIEVWIGSHKCWNSGKVGSFVLHWMPLEPGNLNTSMLGPIYCNLLSNYITLHLIKFWLE